MNFDNGMNFGFSDFGGGGFLPESESAGFLGDSNQDTRSASLSGTERTITPINICSLLDSFDKGKSSPCFCGKTLDIVKLIGTSNNSSLINDKVILNLEDGSGDSIQIQWYYTLDDDITPWKKNIIDNIVKSNIYLLIYGELMVLAGDTPYVKARKITVLDQQNSFNQIWLHHLQIAKIIVNYKYPDNFKIPPSTMIQNKKNNNNNDSNIINSNNNNTNNDHVSNNNNTNNNFNNEQFTNDNEGNIISNVNQANEQSGRNSVQKVNNQPNNNTNNNNTNLHNMNSNNNINQNNGNTIRNVNPINNINSNSNNINANNNKINTNNNNMNSNHNTLKSNTNFNNDSNTNNMNTTNNNNNNTNSNNINTNNTHNNVEGPEKNTNIPIGNPVEKASHTDLYSLNNNNNNTNNNNNPEIRKALQTDLSLLESMFSPVLLEGMKNEIRDLLMKSWNNGITDGLHIDVIVLHLKTSNKLLAAVISREMVTSILQSMADKAEVMPTTNDEMWSIIS